MAIKGGSLLHSGNLVLLDRLQSGGPGTVNLNRTKIYELGNYQSVGSVVDLPETSWSMESFDASAEFEALLTGKTFASRTYVTGTATAGAASALTDTGATWSVNEWTGATITITSGTGSGQSRTVASNTATVITTSTAWTTNPAAGSVYTITLNNAMKFSSAYPIDVVSHFKAGATATTPYNVVGSVAIPFLTLESVSYKFGLSDSASQTCSLKGDLVYYNPAATLVEETTGTNTANQSVPLAQLAVPFTDSTVAGGVRYALSVSLASGKRLTYGSDYTENASGGGQAKTVTLTILAAVAASDKIRVTYGTTSAVSYPQASHAVVSTTRPAALRGRNIEVYIGGHAISNRWTSVQSVQLDWKVTLQRDEEFSNSQIVSQDYDVPDVTGNVVLKPRDYAELYAKIRQIAGVTSGESAGPLTTTPLSLDIVLKSDVDGSPLKTLSIPDARFNLPGYSGRVQQKLEVTFDWTSDTGDMTITQGRPW